MPGQAEASLTAVRHDRTTIRRLVLFGLVYNVAEGILCVSAGVAAGSVVLIGFGLDSGIEAFAALAAWRFLRGEVTEETEEKLSRLIGWTFLTLAAYVVIQSAHDLILGEQVAASRLGLVVTAVSLLVMPYLGFWKLRLARRLGSRGLEAEAKETIACSYLSFFAVLGVAVRYLGGPSWVDPVAALLMVPWLLREGIEKVRGEEHAAHLDEGQP
jgi:divalent metal cation (Fe/Co/Zn/Cd) transporter